MESKKTILLVDDDKFLVTLYEKKFVEGGWEVVAALSATEALQKLRDGLSPRAVVFDLTMPTVDGAQFLAAVRKENLAPRAAIIALTNDSVPEKEAAVRALGIDDFVVKASAVPSEIAARITRVAESKNKK